MTVTRRGFLQGLAVTAGFLPSGCRLLRNPDTETAVRIRAEIQKQIADGTILGAAVDRGGSGLEVYEGRQGPRPDARPMDADTRFDLASVTKTITASVCASLVSEGRLDPEAPFTQYLPEHVLGTSGTITVRDLATHASGFGNFSGPRYSEDPAVNGGAAGFEAELLSKKPVRPRGTYCYSCYNYALLGTVAERAGGQRLDRLAEERIFRPLGMRHTAWWPVADDGHVVTVPLPMRDGRLRKTGEVHDEPARYAGRPIGNAGVFAPLSDMLLFVEDLLSRRRFHPAHYDLLSTCTFEKDGARRSFGFSLSPVARPDGFSSRTFLHAGFTGQLICVDPEQDFAGVVLTLRNPGKKDSYAGRLRLMKRLCQGG